MRLYGKLVLVFLLAASGLVASNSSESSFQLAPAPIPYPYFEPGATDGKIDFSYLRLDFDQYSFNGMSAFGKARKAFTDSIAIDGMAGLMYLSGQLPGVGPISPLPAYAANGSFLGYYTPIPAKNGNASILSLAFSANLELQVVRSPLFNAIIFAGPSLNVTSLTLKTLYNKYYVPTGTTYTGFTDTLTTSIMLGGIQAGMQIDIPLGSMIRMSPFFVISSMSGSATITDDPGTKTTNAYSASFEVPASTTTSLGFDIFINEISIGAMAQSGKSTQTGSNSSYLQLSVGYVFSSRDQAAEKAADAKPDEEATEETAKREPAEKKPAAKKAPAPKTR
ncbi:MAG TPA: hypothetical protein PKM44_04530 [Turneriella sp.]|nr:hypothetical protein [Turneriella sp.]